MSADPTAGHGGGCAASFGCAAVRDVRAARNSSGTLSFGGQSVLSEQHRPQASPAVRIDHLVRLSAAGNRAAFNSLYDACSAQVYGLTHRILRDHAQAEEVTQDIFLQIWIQAARFDETRGSAMAWIMTLSHHKAVDRVRTSQASRNRDGASFTAGFMRDFDPVPEKSETEAETHLLRVSLTTLTALQRESILLVYFGGHTHSEVGVLLAIPIGTVKTRIRDGLLKLRRELSPPVPDEELVPAAGTTPL